MKKIIAAILISLITIGSLAGCGKTSGNTAGNTTNNTSQNSVDNPSANLNVNSADNSEVNTEDIGSERASEIALGEAGFTESDVSDLYISRDYENGKPVYDVHFRKDTAEYDYEILASTGEIISFDLHSQRTQNRQDDVQNGNNPEITLEKAKELVLDRIPGAEEQNMKIELDYDDGYSKYEGEIIYEQKEYDFEIDANTGTFLKWSEESF